MKQNALKVLKVSFSVKFSSLHTDQGKKEKILGSQQRSINTLGMKHTPCKRQTTDRICISVEGDRTGKLRCCTPGASW